MQTVSAYILTYNEAEKLKAAAESVLWADEIVVVDSHSTDGTDKIVAALGARVLQVPFSAVYRAPRSGRSVRRHRLRSNEPCRRGLHACLRVVRCEPRVELFKIHPPAHAPRRPDAWGVCS